MARQQNMNIGYYAFLIGVIIAIIAGIMYAGASSSVTPDLANAIAIVLIVLGIVVGFLNLMDKEVGTFLLAVIALAAVGGASFISLGEVGKYIAIILTNIVIFIAPAAVIVSLKVIWDLATK